ncbi:hypothetical protein MCHI_001743 [Candidatus Magnetoovum chiemensis]|nr:hypothetical protein MCHI_001743 [Candidatus Magnetoovum chiemensis]
METKAADIEFSLREIINGEEVMATSPLGKLYYAALEVFSS